MINQKFISVIFMISNLLFIPLMADEILPLADKRPQVSPERKDIDQSKVVISDIKSKTPFVNVEQEKQWYLKNINDDKLEDEIDLDADISWLNALVEFISMLIEAALWIVPVVILFYLYRYREYWMNLIQRKEHKPAESELPETLFGLDMRQESLADNIEKAADDLWQQKQYRQAVSLLYRGALTSLFKAYRFELPAGATEEDCIELIGKSMQGGAGGNVEQRYARFKQLTAVWVAIAYAHKLPDDKVFQQICHEWNRCFEIDKAGI